jgi:hypothetical protein
MVVGRFFFSKEFYANQRNLTSNGKNEIALFRRVFIIQEVLVFSGDKLFNSIY